MILRQAAHVRRLAALVLIAGAFAACKSKPTEQECRAGWKHAFELQIDQLPQAMASAGAPAGDMPAGPNGQTMQDALKSQIDAMLTPRLIADCVDRAQKDMMQCAATATSSDDIVKRCHWKDLPGGKIGY